MGIACAKALWSGSVADMKEHKTSSKLKLISCGESLTVMVGPWRAPGLS